MEPVRTTVQIVEVSVEESGRKLLSFLSARQGRLPEGLFMRLVRTGQVRIDGKRCKPFARVQAGQKVRIPPMSVEIQDRQQPCGADLDIVDENETMLVINKPSGLPVHPGTGWTDSVHNRLKSKCANASFVPVPVHRLDRDTSGLLLCAKTHVFLRSMHAIWGSVTKAYLCWVHGPWSHEGWLTIRARLAKQDSAYGERMSVGQGKDAITHVYPLRVTQDQSLLLVVLGTGRTHQIRAHLASIAHPIIGDGKYGRGGGTLLLHATALSWSATRMLILPKWPDPHSVDQDLAEKMTHVLTAAPRKEGPYD